VKRKEGAGNSAPSYSSKLSLILNQNVLLHLVDSDQSRDTSRHSTNEIHSTNTHDSHSSGPLDVSGKWYYFFESSPLKWLSTSSRLSGILAFVSTTE
jgi:hypothetical protein